MPKKYVSPKDIGLTNDSKVRVYRHCPSSKSLNPDNKDLVIYGSPERGYIICSYKDFEERGTYARTFMSEVRYADILKDFREKNYVKIPKLKANHKEYLDLIEQHDAKVYEYNAAINSIEQSIRQVDDQIQGLERQLEELKKQKKVYEDRRYDINTNRDEIFKKSGNIEVKRENLLKLFQKHVKSDAKLEDMNRIIPDLTSGRIYYYDTRVE